jgi:hypothetical protein
LTSGCIIDGKWTVVDLEQADMQDESNLFFIHQGRKFRVETNSRGYPSMTALNAAFNDSDEETQTLSKIFLPYASNKFSIIHIYSKFLSFNARRK